MNHAGPYASTTSLDLAWGSTAAPGRGRSDPRPTSAPPSGPDWRNRATLSVEEAARILEVGEDCVRQAIRLGQLPVLQLGRKHRVPVPALLRLLAGESPV